MLSMGASRLHRRGGAGHLLSVAVLMPPDVHWFCMNARRVNSPTCIKKADLFCLEFMSLFLSMQFLRMFQRVRHAIRLDAIRIFWNSKRIPSSDLAQNPANRMCVDLLRMRDHGDAHLHQLLLNMP